LYVATPIVTQCSSSAFIVGKGSILISVVLQRSYLEYICIYSLPLRCIKSVEIKNNNTYREGHIQEQKNICEQFKK
jgi:hypothetical protein